MIYVQFKKKMSCYLSVIEYYLYNNKRIFAWEWKKQYVRRIGGLPTQSQEKQSPEFQTYFLQGGCTGSYFKGCFPWLLCRPGLSMNLIHRTFLVVLQSRQVSRRSELCEWSRDSNGWIPWSSFCPRTQLWGLCDIPRSQARWGEWDKNKDNRPHLVQVTEGSPVLTNSYTLTPVPGAILHAGGVPVLGQVLGHHQHPLLSCSLQSSARRRVSKSTWKVWKSSRQPLGHVTCSFATWGASYQTWRASSSFAGGVNGDDCLILAGQVRELTKV